MQARFVSAIAAGLAAGVVFGVMMQMMRTPEGEPMMVMVAQIVGTENLFVGWLYHLFNSAVIGAIFGWLLGERTSDYTSGLGWGAAYGFVWWILGGLILMPMFLGMAPFAPLMMQPMWPMALGSLIGHLIYGLILGAGFVMLERSVFRTAPAR